MLSKHVKIRKTHPINKGWGLVIEFNKIIGLSDVGIVEFPERYRVQIRLYIGEKAFYIDLFKKDR